MTALTWKAEQAQRFPVGAHRLRWEIFFSMGGILSWERI